MTNRDFFRRTGESLDWCECFSFADGSVHAAVLAGKIVGLNDNGVDCGDPVPADDIHRLAVRLNDCYDLCHGYSDTELLLHVEHEKLSCCECPWFGVCNFMDERPDCIGEIDAPCRECPCFDICDDAVEEADNVDEDAD